MVAILDYNTFKINTTIPQPTTNIDDLIYADFRYRSEKNFYFSFQPVRRVVSCIGEVSGALDPTTNYTLYKDDDPLLTGESTIATDHLLVTQYGGKPSGAQITVNAEEHVLVGFEKEPLGSIGINSKTIRVFSLDRVTEYNRPELTDPDFEIIEGTPTTPVKILRTAASTIKSGQTVSVDYTHDENFVVTYVINDLLQELQQTINNNRHITADVLCKQAIENLINLETTVQLNLGSTKDTVDPLVRTAVSLVFNERTIGQGVAQSNADAAINDTTGVAFNVLPFALMAYADGSRKLREELSSAYIRMTSLDTGAQRVYILTEALENPTTDNGGLITETRGVFEDDIAMTLASTIASVGAAQNQAFIIGSSGAVILGYSDDATLTAEGYTTPATREAERLRRTANHVLISLLATVDPLKHKFTCTYVIRGQTGSHDITATSVEFVNLGDFVITWNSMVAT